MGIKKRAKGAFEKLVPISPEFYDNERDEDLIAEKNVLLPFNAFLLFSQWAAFIALMVYYSGPANYVSKTRMEVDYHYGYPAYNCTPMIKDDTWGNYFNYDTCKALSAQPTKGINVASYEAEPNDPARLQDILSGGTGEVVNKGYVYYPFPHLGTEENNLAGLHERTYDLNIFPSIDAATTAESSMAAKLKTLNTCGLDGGYEGGVGKDGPWVITSEMQPVWSENTAVQMTQTGVFCVDYSTAIGTNLGLNDLYAADSCYFNHSWPMLQNVMNMLGEEEWVSPGTQPAEDIFNGFFSSSYKRGLSTCTITEDEAVNMFQEYYNDGLCNYAKANVPFSCLSEGPPSIPQRFSLAYANSLLLYTVFSTICVKIFFASRKEPKDEVTESEEKSTRV